MKLKDLLSHDIAVALINHTFNTRAKNKAVFDYYDSVKKEYDYIFSEVGKIQNLEISSEEQNQKFAELLDEEITSKMKTFFLEEKDFEEENCLFPREKMYWLNEQKIRSVIAWCEQNKNK